MVALICGFCESFWSVFKKFRSFEKGVRTLVNEFILPTDGAEPLPGLIPIRYYEWSLSRHIPEKAEDMHHSEIPKSWEFASKSRMGHSIGVRASDNIGTIFCFVRLYVKDTGKRVRVPGKFAIIPHQVATNQEEARCLTEGDSKLPIFQSPGLFDINRTLQMEAKKLDKLRRDISEWEARSNPAKVDLRNLEKLRQHYTEGVRNFETLVNFQPAFGKVVYTSGLKEFDIKDGINFPTVVDFAIIKLDEGRDGINQLPEGNESILFK